MNTIGLCLNVSSFRITSWALLVHGHVLLLFSLLFAYVSHHIFLVLAATPPHYPILPISLNSLDLAGVRLLSPRDSQILPNSCRCRGYQCKWCYRTQVGVWWRPWSLVCVFSGWSVVEPSWDDRGSSIWGCLLLFWFRSRTYVCTLIDVWFIFVLCEVVSVRKLCISPFILYITWDVVKIA